MGDPGMAGSYIDEQGVLWVYDPVTGGYVPATAGSAQGGPPAMTPEPRAGNPYMPAGAEGWSESMGAMPADAGAAEYRPSPPPEISPPPQAQGQGQARRSYPQPARAGTGAAAGRNGYVRPPRDDLPRYGPSPGSFNPSMGGGGGSSRSGGGGGGDVYQAIRSRLVGGITGSGEAATEAQYRRDRRNQTQDWRRFERDQTKFGKLSGLMSTPMPWSEGILGEGAATGSTRDYLSGIPAGELAMLTRGHDNRRFLKRPGAFGRTLTDVYGDIVGGGEGYDRQTLFDNLFSAGRNSSLASMFQTQGYPEARYGKEGRYRGLRGDRREWASPQQQMNALMDMIRAAYYPGLGRSGADFAMAGIEAQLDPWMKRQMMRKPGKYKSILDYARRNVTLY